MKIYKITEASDYLGVSINTLKTLANNRKIKSFKTTGEHRRFRQEDLDAGEALLGLSKLFYPQGKQGKSHSKVWRAKK